MYRGPAIAYVGAEEGFDPERADIERIDLDKKVDSASCVGSAPAEGATTGMTAPTSEAQNRRAGGAQFPIRMDRGSRRR